ncbi:MAG TPA: DegV family protein, partial [Acholeplasma sp.]|nr:DegV family protein [Acholeplasma sp.]
LSTIKDKVNDLFGLLSNAFKQMKAVLDHTPEQLKVLKDNNVVDAGAKGFYHFLDGFIRGLNGEDTEIDLKETNELFLHVEHFEESQHRYCTEVLIEGKNMSLSAIKKMLLPFGDSLVVAGHKDLARIHIHTDKPASVFEIIEPVGTIIDQKVDDMKRQFEVANHRLHKIALVTDSIADLPDGYAESKQIHVLNLSMLINDVTYYDKLTIENSRFYQLMHDLKEYPKSSQPNPRTIENLYSFLTTYYDEIIVITVSGKMSGTYQAFLNGAKLFSDHKIKVIDSLQNSVAEGVLVKKAMELIEQGNTYDEVIKQIEHLKSQTKILVSVQTLKYMIRSGRLKKSVGFIGKLVNLKPIISIDDEGMGIIEAKAFSTKKSDQLIFDHITKIVEESGIETYALVHVNALDRVAKYSDVLERITGFKPDYVSEISSIVAMNAGIGSVAIAYIKKIK